MTPSSEPPTTSSTQSTTSPAPSGLPGGVGNLTALAAAGDLTDDGRVDLYGQDAADSTGGEDSAELCTFLFGTPSEIAEITRLAGDLSLDPISGRHSATADATAESTAEGADADGPDGAPTTVIACVYQADSAPMLALQVGDGPPIDPDLPGQPIIVDSNGLHAVLSYSPDHVGPTIAPATARDWLTAVIGRVAPPSTGAG